MPTPGHRAIDRRVPSPRSKVRSRRYRRASIVRAGACASQGHFRPDPSAPGRQTGHPARPAIAARYRAATRSDARARRRAARAWPSTMPAECPASWCRARPGRSARDHWLIELARQNLVAQILGDEALVLNDPVIRVDDVQRAVGAFERYTGRNRSSVDARNSAPSYAFFESQRGPVVFHDQSADEIGRGLGEEDVAVQLGRQPIAAVDRRRTHRREPRQPAVGPENAVLIATIDAGRRPHRPDDVDSGFCRDS